MKVVNAATRAGCKVQQNTPDAFSAACPLQTDTVIIACAKRGTLLTRGCRQGTAPEVCRTVWESVLANVDP